MIEEQWLFDSPPLALFCGSASRSPEFPFPDIACSFDHPPHTQHESTASDTQSKVEKSTEKELSQIDEQFKKQRDQVVQKLLDRVVDVKMEMHRNAAKVE